MHIGFDESGHFEFSEDEPGDGGFESAVIAGLICPDSEFASTEAFVKSTAGACGAVELHAAKLPAAALAEVCAYIGTGDLTWVATYTDSRIFPRRQQYSWRERQIGPATHAVTRSVTLERDPLAKQAAETMLGRIEHASRVSPGDYLEFMALYPRVIGDAIQAAVTAYQDAQWAPSFARWRFELDRKLPNKTTRAEKTLKAALRPILAGDERFRLDVPAAWGEQHPFFAAHANPETGMPAVPSILDGGPHFVDSRASAVVQLADCVSHVVRRMVRNPDDAEAQRMYRLMRPRRFAVTGFGVRFFYDSRGPEPAVANYAHVA